LSTGGSGTTIAAAIGEGKRGLGIELDPEYAAIARARCCHAAHQANLRLF